MSTARRRVAAALGAVLTVTATASACGIRSTSVPVDAGPAPSRVSCAAPSTSATASATASAGPRQEAVRVYLVCRSAQVAPVWRSPATPSADRLGTARLLLAELRRGAGAAESSAGFASNVPSDLELAGTRRGDPAGALRLSVPLEELPPFALAQLVCTFAGTPAGAADDTVLLAGSGTTAPRRYSCTEGLRTDASRTAGTAVN